MCLTDAELRRVVAGDLLHGGDGVFAGDFNSPMWLTSKIRCRGAHRHVLASNARALDGHLPAGKRHHPGVQCTVTGVEWESFERGGGRRSWSGSDCSGRLIVRAFDTFVDVADLLIVLDVRIVLRSRRANL